VLRKMNGSVIANLLTAYASRVGSLGQEFLAFVRLHFDSVGQRRTGGRLLGTLIGRLSANHSSGRSLPLLSSFSSGSTHKSFRRTNAAWNKSSYAQLNHVEGQPASTGRLAACAFYVRLRGCIRRPGRILVVTHSRSLPWLGVEVPSQPGPPMPPQQLSPFPQMEMLCPPWPVEPSLP
jgi:hypothetical protein